MVRLDPRGAGSVQARLAHWAATVVGPQATVGDVVALPGHSGHSYAFTLHGSDWDEGQAESQDRDEGPAVRLVLRVSAPDAPPGSVADTTRLVPILRTLRSLDVPVPAVKWSTREASWFGGSATVVDFVAGRSLPDLFDHGAPPPGADLDVPAVFRHAVGVLARLHGIGITTAAGTGAGPADPPGASPEPAWQQAWGRVKRLDELVERSTRPLRRADDPAWVRQGLLVRDLLLETMPEQPPPGIVHSDFYSNNWIVGPSEVRAVLDWETSFLGPRQLDIGWLCMMYDPDSWGPARRAAMGWHPRPDELAGWYEQLSGVPVADLDWYRALAGYRLACGTAYYLDLHRRAERPDPVWEDAAESFVPMLDRAAALVSSNRPHSSSRPVVLERSVMPSAEQSARFDATSRSEWVRLAHDANVPSLLMIIFQVTGDARWLAAPYTPTRAPGMEDHDHGGLPTDVQDEIRAEAARCLWRLATGEPAAVPTPDTATLSSMLTVCMGEEVSLDYAALLAKEWDDVLAERPSLPASAAPDRAADDTHSTVLVIGSGVSGLSLAHSLVEAGVDFVVVEKSDDVGGVWRDNRYPGCGVDTPSHLYSHSYFRYDWSRYFAKRDEVHDYLRQLTDGLGLRRHIRFGLEVTALDWDETARHWRVTLRDGHGAVVRRTARVVATATGQLNIPKIPAIPGAETFGGPLFHSARWPADLDLTGKRVAVVGTGASAMQIVPKIVDRCDSVTIFQRSPQWIAPNSVYFSQISDSKRALLAASPLYRFWYRARLSWTHNDKVHPSLRRDPTWPHPERSVNEVNDGHRRYFERYLRDSLGDRADLVAKSLPDYPPFGKRMLLDNGWFDAIKRADVELVTEAVTGFTADAVVSASGGAHQADVVVLATGFESLKLLHPITVRGRGGVDLHEYWGDDDAHAYLGMALPGFPNLLFMCGPNTNLGHGGSWIQMAEFQAHYIAAAARKLRDAPTAVFDCKPGVERVYTARVDDLHATMIWTHPGMRNWYRNAAGRVVTNSPWRIVDYWVLTHDFDEADYDWADNDRADNDRAARPDRSQQPPVARSGTSA